MAKEKSDQISALGAVESNSVFLSRLVTAVDNAFRELSENTGRADFLAAIQATVREAQLAEKQGVRIPFMDVVRRFDLDAAEQAILALAVCPELDTSLRTRFQALSAGTLVRRCTVDLALRLFYESRSDQIDGQRLFRKSARLLSNELIELKPPPLGSSSLLDQEIGMVGRISRLLLGHQELDDEMATYCALETSQVELDRIVLPPEQVRHVTDLVRHHKRYRQALVEFGFSPVVRYGKGIVLLFSGPPGTGKTMLARALSTLFGMTTLRVFPDRLANMNESAELILRRIFREAIARDALVLVDECEPLFAGRGARVSAILSAMEDFPGIVVLTTNHPEWMDSALERRILYQVDFRLPSPTEREALWEAHIPPEIGVADDVDLSILANSFEFSGGMIKNAVLFALNRALAKDQQAPTLTAELLLQGAQSQLRHNIDQYTEELRPTLTLADLVLPDPEMEQIQELLDAAKAHTYVLSKWGFGKRLVTGKGIVALFDGPPGTGKTLCAEILASELRRPLYRINVPQVVSKYIGETEQNLAEVFKRAKAARSMLLFDEADSLFGSRTEAKSSNDRYANMEVNVLLQEIERYDGIVILTTNLYGNLDDAMKRRLQFRVSFSHPEWEQRKKIWERLLPPEAPLAKNIDFARLAKSYPLSGGHIKNAILRAAYSAHAKNIPIDHHLLEASALRESQALGIAIQDPEIARALDSDWERTRRGKIPEEPREG